MSSTAVAGIGELVTCDGTGADLLGIHSSAALVVEDGMIAWIGSTAAVPAADNSIDVGGRVIIPGFVDSHSHLVFAGDRTEFAARMTGQPYDGGGIGVTVAATRAATDDELTRPRVADRRNASPRHDHGRDQERLRVDGCRRSPVTPDCSPVHHRNHLPGCPRYRPSTSMTARDTSIL